MEIVWFVTFLKHGHANRTHVVCLKLNLKHVPCWREPLRSPPKASTIKSHKQHKTWYANTNPQGPITNIMRPPTDIVTRNHTHNRTPIPAHGNSLKHEGNHISPFNRILMRHPGNLYTSWTWPSRFIDKRSPARRSPFTEGVLQKQSR